MKRHELINKLKEFQQKDSNNLKKRSWFENRIYWERKDKLERMVVTDFFLRNRREFRSLIFSLYGVQDFCFKSTESIARSLFDVCGYDFIENKLSEECQIDVHLYDLLPLLESERQSVVREIEKTNYTLFPS